MTSGWSVRAEDTWFDDPGQGEIQLLKYPYPCVAALAISNDTDGMDLKTLDAFHDYVNGVEPTPYGNGLGLEVGDSFWIWSPEGQLALRHGRPNDRGLGGSVHAARLAELGRAGLLDTLHSMGAWRDDTGIDRAGIERGLEILDRHGIMPAVHTNHGGSGALHGGGGINLVHNVGGPWGYYQAVDDAESPTYALDLMRDFGFRFFWTDPFYEVTKFGDHLRFPNSHRLNLAASDYDFRRFFRTNSVDDQEGFRDTFPGFDAEEIDAIKRKVFNRTLSTFEVRDGPQMYFFKRFRGNEAPNAGNFCTQVSTERLDELEAREGSVVIYQHFGIWRAMGRQKNHPSEKRTLGDPFDEHCLWAWKELARRQEQGRLFITTTGRLLEYLRVRDNLKVETMPEAADRRARIRLVEVSCPVMGRSPVSASSLQGLGFRFPSNWDDPLLIVDGMRGVPEYRREPDQAFRGFDVLHFPWQRLEYPQS